MIARCAVAVVVSASRRKGGSAASRSSGLDLPGQTDQAQPHVALPVGRPPQQSVFLQRDHQAVDHSASDTQFRRDLADPHALAGIGQQSEQGQPRSRVCEVSAVIQTTFPRWRILTTSDTGVSPVLNLVRTALGAQRTDPGVVSACGLRPAAVGVKYIRWTTAHPLDNHRPCNSNAGTLLQRVYLSPTPMELGQERGLRPRDPNGPSRSVLVVPATRKALVDGLTCRAHGKARRVAVGHPHLPAQSDHRFPEDRTGHDLVLLHVVGELLIVIALLKYWFGSHQRVTGQPGLSSGFDDETTRRCGSAIGMSVREAHHTTVPPGITQREKESGVTDVPICPTCDSACSHSRRHALIIGDLTRGDYSAHNANERLRHLSAIRSMPRRSL